MVPLTIWSASVGAIYRRWSLSADPWTPKKKKEKDDEGSREQKVNRQENNNNKERQIRHRHQRSIRHLGDVPRVHFDA